MMFHNSSVRVYPEGDRGVSGVVGLKTLILLTYTLVPLIFQLPF